MALRTNKKRTKIKGFGKKGSTGTSRGAPARRVAKKGRFSKKGYFG